MSPPITSAESLPASEDGLARSSSHPPGAPTMATTPPRVALLVLADGRLPAGAYAHSLGLEEAVAQGVVRDAADVARYAQGATATVGMVAAALAIAAWSLADDAAGPVEWARLDAEADARMASPSQRSASRQLGRHLRRAGAAFGHQAAAAVDAGAAGHHDGPHQAVAFGALAWALELTRREAAIVPLYSTATGVVQAAVRLVGLDPLAAVTVVAELGPWMQRTAAALADDPPHDPAALPAPAAPALDHLVEHHRHRDGRLFIT